MDIRNIIIKVKDIILCALPIVLMIYLIPLVRDDYILATIYILVACSSLLIKKEENDLAVYFFGVIALFISEWFFINTGTEIFLRDSLFGIMPIWLPFLWGYAFVVIKRSIKILEQ